MSKMGWQRSNLKIGEQLRVPRNLLIEPEKGGARLISTTYAGETDAGILVDFAFRPGIITVNPNGWHYKMLINWASIWCGHIKVHRINGEQILAKREQGLPITAADKD